jgi:signal transduction histidine kinase/ActR/RegA family two-component response regulator
VVCSPSQATAALPTLADAAESRSALQLLRDALDSSGFMPHGHCYLWQPDILWLHLISDSVVALSYFAIPLLLIYFVTRRNDTPFRGVFWMFSTFIVACGLTHVMGIIEIWKPVYRLSGLVKAATGLVSAATALAMVRLIPQALALRSPAEIQAINDRLALEVEERTRELARANHAKSQFLANVSHEIRTPMTAILGFSDLLLQGGDIAASPDERAAAVRTIRRNGEYLLQLINDLLDLSKVEAGALSVQLAPVDPARIVEEVAELMLIRARQTGVGLRVEYEGAIPQTIPSDPLRLRQVLINIVGNALKFTEQGEVVLALGTERGAEPRLAISVRDSGPGIDAADLERLFQPFEQGDASITRRSGGTGLGLSISRKLVELLGGEISVQSEKGVGSEFRISLPVGPAQAVRWVTPRPSADPALPAGFTRESPDLHGRRILLVEDGPDNQRLFRYLLESAGASLVVAGNGQDAASLALQAERCGTPFDVVLMDMQMPVMDGYTAASFLRRSGYRGRIVALTAYAMAGERERCLAAGCDAFAIKPIDRRTLIEAASAPTGSGA